MQFVMIQCNIGFIYIYINTYAYAQTIANVEVSRNMMLKHAK